MKAPGPAFLGITYLLSEVFLSATRRSRGSGVRQDRSTLGILWLVIGLSVAASVYGRLHVRAAALPHHQILAWVSIIIFAAGLALRWWAIIVLGRFFTIDVQIAKDHELIERGPFRFVRHPSYTGVLLAFLGLGLSLDNWVALLVLLVPITAAFIHRMNVEEEALETALGKQYATYMRRTKRLLPGIY